MDFTLVMDNDSGYVSHYQESADSYPEQPQSGAPATMAPFYLNEDALQEQPLYHNTDAYDSVVSNSVESVKTDFSGFEDDPNCSFTIPEAPPIVVTAKELGGETPNRYENRFDSGISPDLFDDDDSAESRRSVEVFERVIEPNSDDLGLFKRVQTKLSGVCPPPSVTIVQLTAGDILERINANRELLFQKPTTATKLSTVFDNQKMIDCGWPQILHLRQHGLHYNKNRLATEFEQLCTKYGERFVGAETSSSLTVFNNLSPLKRRPAKPKWQSKSPGRRLSHLARRRITFSNSTLLQSTNSCILGSRAQQILIDAKKVKKSPAKSPKRALQSRHVENKGDSVKRTLFGSPHRPEARGTKRALFSSPGRKRKRSEDETEAVRGAKVAKLEELSDLHKKKLQWAVYEALRHQNIEHTHAQFKVFASVLARVTRKLLNCVEDANLRTTERMRRIAKFHSFAVVKGKSVDEVINEYQRSNAIKAMKPIGYVGIDDFSQLKCKESNKENVLQDKANIIESIEKRREFAGNKPKFANESRIDRIRKVISFDENGK